MKFRQNDSQTKRFSFTQTGKLFCALENVFMMPSLLMIENEQDLITPVNLKPFNFFCFYCFFSVLLPLNV